MTPETSLSDPLLVRIKQAMRRASEGTLLAADTAQTEYQTAMDLCEMVGTDETRLTDLDEQHDLFILDWAIELPFQLAHAGLVEEAATLAERFAAITEADNFLPDRAIILAEAGRGKRRWPSHGKSATFCQGSLGHHQKRRCVRTTGRPRPG